MEIAKGVAQSVVEHVATYRVGKWGLRQLDKALWVVEKSARWAVPTPLDQDERPQPELVRPLSWVFFLPLLVALRVTREAVSLVNLVLGKPPVRSADVVSYIQGKRRYLRALKYQSNRMTRSRPQQESWITKLRSLLEFTMCFRRSNYGNNNTLRASNNDQVVVVKRSKREPEAGSGSPVAVASTATAGAENSMERLIEKMMVDLDADSDDDSSFTLTNATSFRSAMSDTSETDSDTLKNHNDNITPGNCEDGTLEETNIDSNVSPTKGDIHSSAAIPNASSTPEKDHNIEANVLNNGAESEQDKIIKDNTEVSETNVHKDDADEETKENVNHGGAIYNSGKHASPKEETQRFIKGEKMPQKNQLSPKTSKIANGRALSAPNKRRGRNRAPRREDKTNESL